MPPASPTSVDECKTPVIPRAAGGEPAERRLIALDGFRGLMTILVVVSHYFSEIPGGIGALSFAWVAVDAFFALSGFLVGRMIIEKGASANFYTVFYIRRICRTFPIYFVCVIITMLLVQWLAPGMQRAVHALPSWSYFTFTQNIMMSANQTIGADWLAPTWTLAVEEQFYLFAPAIMLLTPTRFLVPLLVAIALASLGWRIGMHLTDLGPLASLVLLSSRADNLVCGMLAAVAFVSYGYRGTSVPARAAPVVVIAGLVALILVEGSEGMIVATTAHLFTSMACALFIVSIASGTPEAARFSSPVLRFFGTTSYAVYLTHLPVLWLVHWTVLGHAPQPTGSGLIVTLICLPLCVGISAILTKAIEEPVTRYGRSWSWQARTEQTRVAAQGPSL